MRLKDEGKLTARPPQPGLWPTCWLASHSSFMSQGFPFRVLPVLPSSHATMLDPLETELKDIVHLQISGGVNINCSGDLIIESISIKSTRSNSPSTNRGPADGPTIVKGISLMGQRNVKETESEQVTVGRKRHDALPCKMCVRVGGHCKHQQEPKDNREGSSAGQDEKSTFGIRKKDGKPCKRCIAWKRFCNLHQDQIPKVASP